MSYIYLQMDIKNTPLSPRDVDFEVYCTNNMYVYQVYILCISNKHKYLVDMFEENDVFLS